MVSALSRLPTEQDSNPYQVSHPTDTGSWTDFLIHIHIDLVGPLPQSCGHTFLFTIVDRTSRWPEAIPLQSTTAEECVKVLLLVLDPNLWNSICDHLRSWSTVHKLYLD
jgi:hypothetical protein